MIGFIGHLHPLFVHLPIGILVLAFLFYWLMRLKQYAFLSKVMTLTLLAGTISAFLSCITGYVLSLDGDYASDLVGWHQNIALLTTMLSLGWFYVMATEQQTWVRHAAAIVCMLGIAITGHLGGSLTHGEGYLLGSSGETDSVIARKPVPDVQAAVAYKDLVQPLLQEKCYSCHAANKQKGKLRLDLPEYIMKGGKNGEAIKAGNALESELIKRLLLPKSDDDHMPPEQKPQLTEKEIDLLHWWVASGASFDKKVNELAQTDSIKKVLLSFQGNSSKATPDIPSAAVNPAPAAAIQALKQRGVVVIPVAANSNYLSVNFVSVDSVTDKDIALLDPIKDQLAWLKLSGQPVSDSALKTMASFKNLVKLYLDHTNITDAGIKYLSSLNELKVLNCVGTAVSVNGLSELKGLKKLQQLFVFQTKVAALEWQTLQNLFPSTRIDSGNYVVPTFESDTTIVTVPKR
jgi:uncharacterized membrane protein/mono/diheme cytochrome c family protein